MSDSSRLNENIDYQKLVNDYETQLYAAITEVNLSILTFANGTKEKHYHCQNRTVILLDLATFLQEFCKINVICKKNVNCKVLAR